MRTGNILAIAGALFCFGAPDALAEGDAAAGGKLAREWCSKCHNVEPGGPFKLHPPSFSSIAIYRSPVQIHGRIAFPPLHANMPQIAYIMTTQNIEDLVAYIVSLEKN